MERTLVFPFLLVLVVGLFAGTLAADSATPRIHKRADALLRVSHTRSWRDRVVLRRFGIRAQRVHGVALRNGGRVNGFAVVSVRRASSAARRGLQPGDILIALRGVPVRSGDHLRVVLGGSGLTQDAAITIVRRGKIRAIARPQSGKRVSNPS